MLNGEETLISERGCYGINTCVDCCYLRSFEDNNLINNNEWRDKRYRHIKEIYNRLRK